MVRYHLFSKLQNHPTKLISQQDGAPPQYANIVGQYLDHKHPNRWVGREGPFPGPIRSPGLTACNFSLWN